MSYLVIARKFRPQSFATIVGQKSVTTALANTIKRNRVPHALLFTGPRGVGKTTAARIFSRALNCTNLKEAEPCGECSNCKEINTGSSLAVWEIDGASNNSVDNVRELIDSLRSLPPPGSKYKIYIVDEVHMLSTAAFNALLKSLEEPPANTVFIFATTDPQKIPETVISRCQRYDFKRLTNDEIVSNLSEVLKTEGIKFEKEVLEFVARKAEGGLRDAQSMLDRVLVFSEGKLLLSDVLSLFGSVDRAFYFELAEAIVKKDTANCLLLLDSAFSRSLDVKDFVAEFLNFWRSALLIKFGSSNMEERATFESIVEQLGQFDLQRLFDVAEDTVNRTLRSAYPRFVLEAGVIKMATLSDLKPLSELFKGDSATTSKQPAVSKQLSAPRVEAPVKTANKFNPNWEEFLSFLNRQGLMRLQAYLRRVNAPEFRQGYLRLEAAEFDLNALNDPDLIAQLKSALKNYSESDSWDLQLVKIESAAVAPGSAVEKEKEETKKRRQKLAKEAVEDPALKDILSTFEGSQVEKISILK